jgi:hypothetical protein
MEASTIVQSVAVAAGIFFAIQQYRNSNQEIFEKEAARRAEAQKNTFVAVDATRAAANQVWQFSTYPRGM